MPAKKSDSRGGVSKKAASAKKAAKKAGRSAASGVKKAALDVSEATKQAASTVESKAANVTKKAAKTVERKAAKATKKAARTTTAAASKTAAAAKNASRKMEKPAAARAESTSKEARGQTRESATSGLTRKAGNGQKAKPVTIPGVRQGGKLPIDLANPTAAPKYFFSTELPAAYNQTFLYALPRDPEWIYLYWEFDEKTLAGIQKTMGAETYKASRRILRLLDITETSPENAWGADIEINAYANNWYLKVPESGRRYLVECGHLAPDGSFFLITRSNPIDVPRGSVSEITDEQWMTAHTEELIKASGLRRPIGASEFVTEMHEKGPGGERKEGLFQGASEWLSSGAISSRRA